MKLIEALDILQKRRTGCPIFSVILACDFTPLHLATFLGAHLTRRMPDRSVEIRSGLYGDLVGTLRQAEFERAEAVVAALEWTDLDPRLGIRHLGGWEPERLPEIAEEARHRLTAIREAISAVAGRIPVIASLPTLPLGPVSYQPSCQYSPLQAELESSLSQFAGDLAALRGVWVLNPAELERVSPVPTRHDVKAELGGGFPYQIGHADSLAELLARLVSPPAPKKGLITDLDDTLWRGIVGDDGVDGISWDMDHHAQIHGYYQQLLRSLAHAGVLVGVVSKNSPEVVEQALARTDLLVEPADFFPVEAGWGPKSEAVGRVLEAWNIAADSVVFIDDNPMELDEVGQAHPGIECIRFPSSDAAAIYQLGYRLRDLFGKREVGEEDRLRSQSLRAAQQAPLARSSPTDMEGFLRGANAALVFRWQRPPLEPRILELINKTNQFSLNGRRYTEAEWHAYTERSETEVLLVEYADKYGRLGKIAALTGKRLGGRFQIDTWVLSCRAFSRRIEYHTLKTIFDRWPVEELYLDFAPTARNGPVREFLVSLLPSVPEGPLVLGRDAFLRVCPALYHTVEEGSPAAEFATMK